jgi:hypothetical protein
MTTLQRFTGLASLVVCCVAAVPLATRAQTGPPKVLVINREFLKPGRSGSMHEKTEAGYLAAAKAGKAHFHYLALTSMSGPDRALFLSGYPSLADWEAENKMDEKNPSLGASLDHAMVADGDLLASTDASVWVRRDDLSLNDPGIVGARYMEIQLFTIKPGHMKEWEELVKLYVDGFTKAPGGIHWETFQQSYGTNGNSFIAVTLLKSLADADAEWGSYPGFATAVGEPGMKKISALEASCVDTEQTNLFHISPKMSLPLEDWVKAEPDFWTPKTAAPAKKKAAAPKAP